MEDSVEYKTLKLWHVGLIRFRFESKWNLLILQSHSFAILSMDHGGLTLKQYSSLKCEVGFRIYSKNIANLSFSHANEFFGSISFQCMIFGLWESSKNLSLLIYWPLCWFNFWHSSMYKKGNKLSLNLGLQWIFFFIQQSTNILQTITTN